ncbi:response regulator transcription factor [Limnohabitans radicicola]|uniref:Response regulator transcription factor n=1 Tax=Limnohabitans radicicola TaxID=2771427 RepID=A0A927IKK9_9BURK|nr:winged helix-turn-helix domain-containing protein [Limnohabitans radicicola]MBD8049748.1 response regulator transcription factor [Limnohabitans radicicola]
MQALWVTASLTDAIPLGANGWPRFDQMEHVDWSQALARLRVPVTATDTTWLLQSDAHGPGPDDLRQALTGVKRNLRVLALPHAPLGHPEIAAWLDAGADRCLPRPCPPQVLAAMLRAVHRSVLPGGQPVSHFAGLRFDHEAMTLHDGEQRIALTQREAELMSLLIRRVGKWVTNQEIRMHMAQGGAAALRPGAVHLYVHRVNRKIGPHGLHVDCVKRVGYGLVVRSDAMQQASDAARVLPVLRAHRPFANQAWQVQGSGVMG